MSGVLAQTGEVWFGGPTWAHFEQALAVPTALGGTSQRFIDLVRGGAVLAQEGSFKEAITAFREAIQLKSDSDLAHFCLGAALVGDGQFREAIVPLREAIRLWPGEPAAHFNLGLALGRSGQIPAGIAAFREAVRLIPAGNAAFREVLARAHQGLGAALSEAGQFQDAIAALHEAIRLRPDDASSHYIVGIALNGAGRSADAIAAYGEAIRLRPDLPEPHYNLGCLLAEGGEDVAAVAAFREAVKFNPDFAQAYSNLGELLFDSGQLGEAIAAFREDVRLRPERSNGYGNLGKALSRDHQYSAALSAFRQARALTTDSKERAELGLSIEELAKSISASLDETKYLLASCRVDNDNTFAKSAEVSGSPVLHDSSVNIMDEATAFEFVAAKKGLSVAQLDEAIDYWKAAKAEHTTRTTTPRATAELRPHREATPIAEPGKAHPKNVEASMSSPFGNVPPTLRRRRSYTKRDWSEAELSDPRRAAEATEIVDSYKRQKAEAKVFTIEEVEAYRAANSYLATIERRRKGIGPRKPSAQKSQQHKTLT